jgi:hypothetical protein
VLLFAVPPDRKVNKDNLEDAQVNGQMVSIYAPGMNPWRYPAGAATFLKDITTIGALMILAVHSPCRTTSASHLHAAAK